MNLLLCVLRLAHTLSRLATAGLGGQISSQNSLPVSMHDDYVDWRRNDKNNIKMYCSNLSTKYSAVAWSLNICSLQSFCRERVFFICLPVIRIH